MRIWAPDPGEPRRMQLIVDDDEPTDREVTFLTIDAARELRDCLDAAITYAEGAADV
ncbi:hypothetical protein [Corynebacterium sp. TAE3-ERU16]|uniref:hypothetical protein n=1 Tax=Corynebacterium sp. TAE3-ERU16 TaxID=2849493 RepID=UPI001C439DB4|nr:hypothetical protein [Corynebacterium sp. TAE3-ERU16]MBV7292338.1 hypothetical protein [Corynebacterium sp. TAE3-ERU16]